MGQSTRDIAERLAALFAGHSGAHGTHGEPYQEPGRLKWEIKSTARTLREPPTVELWEQHVAGKRPLGIISIREDSNCLWGSIDVDQYDTDLIEVVQRVEAAEMPLVPCRSKSGGLHLFLFLQDPQPAAAVQAVLQDAAARLGLARSEIFPKQTQVLVERGDLGNWMVMPYFGNTYGGKLREQVGVKKTGAEMTVEEFLRTAEKAKVGAAAFQLLTVKRGAHANGRATLHEEISDFRDGPPCLQHLAAIGVEEHAGRNNALLHMGVYFKRRNPGTWRRDLELASANYMRPPLSAEEIAEIIKSLSRKEYEYTCKAEPMCSHCNATVCRTRRWGVGEEGDLPAISGLSKLDTQPPIWFVDVGGVRLEISTDQLQRYDLFHKACLSEGLVFNLMKQAEWIGVVKEAMRNCVVLEAPAEVGVQGRFREYLEDFLTNRSRGKRLDDLFSGRPFEDEEERRYYFRLQDLQRFLNREDFRDADGRRIGRNKISTMINGLGGGHVFRNIKRRALSAFWVPSDVVEAPPESEPEPPAASPM